MQKEITTNKINKIPSLFRLNYENNNNSFDFSSDEDIVRSKNNESYIFNNFDTENITNNIKEIKNNLTNSVQNLNKISSFNFFIKNNKKNYNKVKKIEKAKEKKNDFKIFISKKRGRKAKDINFEMNNNSITKEEPKIHDKYSDDNMRKKCKNLILKYLFEFINNKIKELYKGDIGHGDFKKELKILNQDKKVNSTVDLDKDFLDKKLIDIFSENISSRLSNYSPSHNKNIIELLINESNEEKREYFKKLFNLKFMDCLKYFRGDNIIIEELKGFKCLSSIKSSLRIDHDKDYIDLLEHYLKNFEEKINNKKSRNRKKKLNKKL